MLYTLSTGRRAACCIVFSRAAKFERGGTKDEGQTIFAKEKRGARSDERTKFSLERETREKGVCCEKVQAASCNPIQFQTYNNSNEQNGERLIELNSYGVIQ